MLSIISKIRRVLSVLVSASIGLAAMPAHADIDFGIDLGIGDDRALCYSGTVDEVLISSQADTCEGVVNYIVPTRLSVGTSSNFVNIQADTGETDFTDVSVQFNGGTQDFTGTTTFGSTVTFNGPSVTFDNDVTTNGIANTGLITSDTVSSNSVLANSATITNVLSSTATVTDGLTVLNGATIDMGNNVVGGVAAGIADTDAVNVAQLNAATSGITTDVTALEQTTATHTTQITNLQSGLATTNSNVAANTANIATNTAAIADNSADIADLQTGLADTNAALGAVDNRVDALEAVTANLGERLDDLKDRSDAGTATAVALSGAMFLPGKTFNLTGNVGAYRGAVAGAMQFGALVSDRAAINAGFAKGFNRHGKVALRAGFTLGW